MAADHVLLYEPVRDRAVTAEKAAINAVMAGCLPEYFPGRGRGGASGHRRPGVQAARPGHEHRRLGADGDRQWPGRAPASSSTARANLFGPGVRANATIGRALRLVLLNCLECRPGVLDKSTQGWPGKYSLCFAEDEAASPWEPLHVSRGLRPGSSAVTVYAAESGHNVLSHGTSDPERLLTCFADAMAGRSGA